MSRIKKKSIFLIAAVVIFTLIGGITTAVYSSTESKVVISLDNDKKWECKENFDKSWYVNTAKESNGTLKKLSFQVDLSYYFKSEYSNLEAPFTATVKTLSSADNAINDVSGITISKVENKSGFFNVSFNAPEGLKDNDKISIDVNFIENNTWNIEPQNEQFELIVDNTNPILNIKNLQSIETTREFENTVSLNCDVNESNLYKVNIDIQKTAYKGAQVENIHREILWSDKENSNHDYISFNNENSFNVNFNDDGYYEVYVTLEDNAGNINNNSNYKVFFQKNKFEYGININGATEVNNNYLITQNHKVNFTFSNYFDITFDEIPYVLTKDNTTFKEEGSMSWGSKDITFPSDGNYTLTITVVKWGMINPNSQQKKNITYTITVDSEAPKVTATANNEKINLENNGEYYFNDYKNIKMSVTDTNLVSSNIEVYKDGNQVYSGSNSLDFNASEEGVYEINTYANDVTGNVINDTYKIYIDKTLPNINVTGVSDGDKFKKGKNETPKVKITASDDNLKNAEAVITRKSKGESDEVQKISLTNEKTYEYEVNKDGIYSIIVTAEDKAGNKPKEDTSINFQRDANAPELKIKADDRELSEYEFNEYNMPYIKNEKGIKIDALINEDYPKLKNDGTKDNESSYIKVKRTPVNQDGEEEQSEEGNNEYFLSEKSITIDKDGKYEVFIYSVDNCGNETERTLFFVLDGTAPDLSVTGVKDYYNGYPDIQIESKDAFQEDGYISITYEKIIKHLDGNDEIYPEETKYIEIDSSKKIINLSDLDEFNEEAEYKISLIKAVDKVGNESSKADVDYTVDTNPPTKSIEGLEDDKLYYNSDRTIVINTEDVNLDTNSVKLTITKDGEVYEPTVEETIQEFNVEERKAYGIYTFSTDGEYTVKLESADKAGNGSEDILEKEFIVDKTLPSIYIDDYETLNGTYINYNKSLNVKINEKNLDNDVNLTYVNIVKKYSDGTVKDDNYVFNLNGECPNYANIYNEFIEDAEYIVTVTAEDKAGNVSTSNPLIFTVDKTVPVQSISGVENDAYYNVDKEVQFSSIDVNQSINTVAVTRDGDPYSIGEDFAFEGFKAFLTYTFSGEGTYEIVFTTTDKAGNTSISTIKFVIDKTAPDIKSFKDDGSELKYGEYINRIFRPEFVLDNSEDFITSVVLNGIDITGNISMASQEMEYNYTVTAKDKAGNVTTIDELFTVDTTNPAITISGIMSGFFNEDLTPEFDITDTNLDYSNTSSTLNGEAFTSGTTIDAQNDFNLKLIGTDLATNSNSQSISFTIDKDGPVISFKNPISGKYFTEDFIPEFLIEDLSDYTIIALTLDGEEYHVGDIIEEEGKHVLYIEVMDKASNTSELSVEFILDKTAPKFIIDGVEDGETYYDATSATVMLDNPLDKINSITVNGEAADGQVSDEYGQQVVNLNFNDIKDYELVLNGTDEAGNTTVQALNFSVAEKTLLSKIATNKKLLYSSLAAVVAVLAIGVTRVFIKRRNKFKLASAENSDTEE